MYVVFFVVFPDVYGDDNIFDHPYPIGALIVAFTFLLSFKANFSYNRYWEAVTAVHTMHSKWLDVGMELAAFHLQSDMYKKKPPAYGQHPDIDILDPKRGRKYQPPPKEQLEQSIDMQAGMTENSMQSKFSRLRMRRSLTEPPKSIGGSVKKFVIPSPIDPVDSKTETPSLFLQESAHLLSLLSAVAMSTLRNDVEAAESPLATFKRGAPWPAVDPDHPDAIREDWKNTQNRVYTTCRYLLGLTRSDRDRTLYNAARPFRVIGGVSDGEVALLQASRGSFAKVALVSVWLQEFMSREYLQGSTGKVGPPIISRLFQFTSDGMLGYNQARKIAKIPFPFPHSQLTSLFVLVIVFYIPVLMLTFVSNVYFGAVLNLFTVMCFAGLHEVSRELENPFTNVPNDIPLNNFQAQFNEALMNMFVGYHPDAYSWLPTPADTLDESTSSL